MTELANRPALEIPDRVRRELDDFVAQVLERSRTPPVSVVAFGSAVSGDYAAHGSDLNVLFVYSELELRDLVPVAPIARKWLRKRRFSARFLTRRDLTETARFFQIDLLGMRDAHVVLHGEPVLDALEISPADLAWQLAHETKRLRMRLKQQFWRAARPDESVRSLLARTSSFLHLYRALLRLQNRDLPVTQRDVASLATRDLGLPPEFLDRTFEWKAGRSKPSPEELIDAWSALHEATRRLDARLPAASG
ncbi:MAG: hypothetical protein KC591_14805 [Gemmatimonadetes bacterium]|nr:hypothetical protein [Gemmatimonadota bacterium]